MLALITATANSRSKNAEYVNLSYVPGRRSILCPTHSPALAG